jgi:type I restriction enzyme S subunit
MSAERQTVPGWQRKRLSDLYAAPSRNGLYKPALHYGDGHQMVHMPQMFRGPIVDLSDAARVKVSSVELNRFGLQEGDLLFARRSLTLEGAGQCSLVPPLSQPATFESSIIRVRVDQQLISPTYANFFLGSEIGFRRRLAFIRQVAVSGVSAGDVAAIPIDFPSIPHQQKITAILSTVDEAIEQTEALIAKYQQIKAGLMHDLFSRGVTPDGQLRPTRSETPHLYQNSNSPLGWIPKDWEVSTLRDSCDWFSGGTPSRNKSEWWNGNFPWLTPKDMKAFELSDTSEHVTKEAALFGSRIVSAGTVFIVVRGMILAHSFPVVLGLKDFAFNQDIKAVQAGDRLTSRFLAYWFVGHTDMFLKKTSEATHGTKRFDLQEITKLSIGLPKTEEQNVIVAQLDAISAQIDSEQTLVAKLRQQKQGLMHDLLTGRVPVDREE